MILNIRGNEAKVEFTPSTLIVAGFTGKDRSSAQAHLRELEEMGIPVPDEIPAFYHAEPGLVTTDGMIEVASEESSGEVEPVLIQAGGRKYIALGSDHTARDLEKSSIGDSKRACRKPISAEMIPLDDVLPRWESLRIRCTVEKDGVRHKYQDGSVGELTNVMDLVGLLGKKEPATDMSESVMFLGTVPLIPGKFIYGDHYAMELLGASGEKLLELQYSVKVRKA